MRETNQSARDHYDPEYYEIRIKGHLDAARIERFEALSFSLISDGTTVLYGPIIDQAALHGILRKVRDLGLPLISVNQIPQEERSV